MEPREGRIPDDDWEIIVRNVPIVSVDLVVLCDGGIVLGKRQNEPAKGEWFVPGGRVKKHEALTEAVHRIAQEEIGVEVKVLEYIGAFEHFYATSDTEKSRGKHYLANGFVVRASSDQFEIDAQHQSLKKFKKPPSNLHPYVQTYLEEMGEPLS